MAKLPIDKIKAAEKLRDEIDNFRSKRRKGSAVAHVAEKYGLNRTTAQNYIKLLSLSDGAKMHVSLGNLAMRNALAILKAPHNRQTEFADLAVNSNLNREEIAKKILLTAQKVTDKAQKKAATEKDPNIKRLIESISENLSTPIQIENGDDGEGVIIINIYFIHVYTAILGNNKQLENCQCHVETSIDLTKPNEQKGFIKFFFNNNQQKYKAIKVLATAATQVKEM